MPELRKTCRPWPCEGSQATSPQPYSCNPEEQQETGDNPAGGVRELEQSHVVSEVDRVVL